MHRIRLRQPWRREAISSEITSVELPDTETLAGRHRYRRRFNRPTGLTSSAKVLLEIRGRIDNVEGVTIGDSPALPLESIANEHRYELTDSLEPHNELLIQVIGALQAEVCLQIIEE